MKKEYVITLKDKVCISYTTENGVDVPKMTSCIIISSQFPPMFSDTGISFNNGKYFPISNVLGLITIKMGAENDNAKDEQSNS